MSRLLVILCLWLLAGCKGPPPNHAPTTRTLASGPEPSSEDGVVAGNTPDHVAAAKAAEAEYHALCDKWAAASSRGENTAAIERAIFSAHSRFVREVLQTKYIPSAAMFMPATVSAAGNLTVDDGTTYSFVIGGGDRDLAMWVWARTEWTADRVPSHGPAGSLGIPENEMVGKLKIGKATREGERSKTVFRVPYTLDDVAGTVEFRVADFSVHPDRGTVDRGHGWHPNAATRPAE